MMKKTNIVELVKFAIAVGIGAVVCAATRPAVKAVLKMDTQKADVDPTPSEDIEEEDITEE